MYTKLNPVYVSTLEALSNGHTYREFCGGHAYQYFFTNGYGISIIKHDGSYGHEQDLWEIAVLKDGELCYDTPITSDVEGWLSNEEVLTYAMKIEALERDE